MHLGKHASERRSVDEIQLGQLTIDRLSLKSAPCPSVLAPDPSHVVLCTPNQTYQLRQVQTSNSVFVLQPAFAVQEEHVSPTLGLSIFARCTSTLEVEKMSRSELSKTKTAIQWLTEALLVHDIDTESNSTRSLRRSKADLFADIPYSDGECEEAWTQLVAFELERRSFRPSGKVLHDLWTCIYQTATVQGIDLAKKFEITDVCSAVEEVGHRRPLFDALINRLSLHDDSEDANSATFDKTTTIRWLGETLFDAGVFLEEEKRIWPFLDRWKSLLPEKWRDAVTTQDLMEVRHLKEKSATESKVEAAVAELVPLQDKGVTKRPALRNWHEKFKRARK